jgi:hypothetical protein
MGAIERDVALLYVRLGSDGRRKLGCERTKIDVAMCPAASAEFASIVLGFRIGGCEEVEFLDVPIDYPETLRASMTDEEIESRLRLAGRCVKGACPHWMGSCALGHIVAEVGVNMPTRQQCTISKTCRWYLENGSSACGPCSGILNINMKEALRGEVS